jgi:glycerophosphoryl diester phosphodiesterase
MIKKALIIASICFLISCTKQDYEIENLNGDSIKALGHGGMGLNHTYPMNSLESVLKCLNLGMDGTELDVQMTKDSVLIAFHDADLSSSTNLKGLVNEYNWSDLAKGIYTESPFLGYNILSLRQLFAQIENLHQYHFSLDIKLNTETDMDSYMKTFISTLINLIEEFDLTNNIYIESQHPEFLSRLKAQKPAYKLFIYPSSFETGLKTAVEMELYGISISNEIVTKDQIESAHDQQIRVMVWKLQSIASNKEAILKNPDIIQTDQVAGLLRLLN